MKTTKNNQKITSNRLKAGVKISSQEGKNLKSAPSVGEKYDGCKEENCTCVGSESTYCIMEQNS